MPFTAFWSYEITTPECPSLISLSLSREISNFHRIFLLICTIRKYTFGRSFHQNAILLHSTLSCRCFCYQDVVVCLASFWVGSSPEGASEWARFWLDSPECASLKISQEFYRITKYRANTIKVYSTENDRRGELSNPHVLDQPRTEFSIFSGVAPYRISKAQCHNLATEGVKGSYTY